MKKLSLLFTFLIMVSCNNTAVKKVADSMTPDAEILEVDKKAGYMKTADAQYDLSLGDQAAVELWDKYIEAHNNQDLETIMAMESETITILGPDGVVTKGKEAHSKFLEEWFKAANPKWSNYFSVPVKVNWDEQPGTWVTNGHNLTLTVDGVESTTGNIADVYIEDAGAVGLISSYWSKAFGANKIFSARTEKIPNVDLNLEDYTMLYRMVENGTTPKVNIISTSKDLGDMPTFNTIAQIKGVEKPEEYVILSAHFDSWDGGQGTTDNGTGSLVMMEAMRILKKIYPNPKRTIMVGHWGSEEQGLNGSRAFVEDFPKIIENTQAVFNQDNGTGRVVNINGQGFLNSYDYLSDWLSEVPQNVKKHIETEFPGNPGGGGTDHASFVAAGVPAFNLSALDWAYWNYTWHTNLDTHDKIVFDDLKNNVILTAILAYKASEDDDKASREQRVMPEKVKNPRTGEMRRARGWPSIRKPNRDGTGSK
ncbi:M20/M25/M40 family metallo-hydrolase [Flavobacteriaceae bacterium]|nr:M20/M25/M40 family metallo-hydrolase [Flavobacteriaceae bacterium]